MKSYKVVVTDTAVLLVAPDNQNRTVYVHHDNDADIVHLGNATVTVDSGFPLHRLETLEIFVPVNESIYAIKDATGDAVDVWVLLPDGD